MEKIQAFLKISFRAKVVVPVVATMVVLLMITVWIVNSRITGQFQAEAARSLAAADAALKKTQTIHRNELLLRYHNLRNEPRYKASFQTGDAETLKDLLSSLRGEHGLDVMVFTTDKSEVLAHAKRDPLISMARFEAVSSEAVHQALQGEEKVDTIRVDQHLFDIVCIPVYGTGDHLVGALTFASELGSATAQDWRDITQCQIVLVANGHVVGSTFGRPELNDEFSTLFSELASTRSLASPRDIPVAGEHYFCSAGHFESLAGDRKLGWLLLSSYEQPLRALQSTQQVLLLVISLGILAGTALVWWLVHRATQPLRDLRDSAEAVGQGDFSRRVVVSSGDECGELAYVFNQMTENLERSRDELHRTV
ncbi:MAG TPA: cache domain-containing protein, partial [Candidatus Dormibacteraeota bacterium]|nr:cache domain-containing protein [Candidatus Dormibacteraeota bacterium]